MDVEPQENSPVPGNEDAVPAGDESDTDDDEEMATIDDSMTRFMDTVTGEAIECHVPERENFDTQLELSIQLYDLVQKSNITNAAYANILKFVNKCLATPELGN